MSTRSVILAVMASMGAVSCRDIIHGTGLSRSQVYNAMDRCWRGGYVLRTAEAIHEREQVFKGRSGVSAHNRPHHLYYLKPEGFDELVVDGTRFVAFSEEYLDPRGGGGVSKAQRIIGFLEENSDRAFFSTEVVEALKKHGVRVEDIMANVRRYERKGVIYVRGYKSEERETPFREGYLLTWLDQDMPRVEALAEAVARTDEALEGIASSSPVMERVHRIRDVIVEHTLLRKIVGVSYLRNQLGIGKQQLVPQYVLYF